MLNITKGLLVVLLAAIFFSAVAKARGARGRMDGAVARWLLGVVASLAVLVMKVASNLKIAVLGPDQKENRGSMP